MRYLAICLYLLIVNGHAKYFDDTYDHLFWFVQVSDIHISHYGNMQRIEEFYRFCNESLLKIKPALVIVTGDITHGVNKNGGSGQNAFEWQSYDRILSSTGVSKNLPWLDIRGNHDTFKVSNWNSKENLFRNYSVTGRKNVSGAFVYTHTLPDNTKYAFLAVDATVAPGPGRPFNFIGQLKKTEVEKIKMLLNDVSQSDGIVIFGHFPTSCINSESESLVKIMSVGAIYLCGHLHTFAHLIPQMYYKHSDSLVELEVGDWKIERLFRVVAFDSGFFSFTDAHFSDRLLIVITNPKHAGMKLKRESSKRMLESDFIRLLVFGMGSPISTVRVFIDGHSLGHASAINNGPLYVLKWAPWEYTKGLHYIVVEAEDTQGNKKRVIQPFSLDESSVNLSKLAKFVLNTFCPHVACVLFHILLALYLIVIIVFRFMTPPTSESRNCIVRFCCQCFLAMHRLCCTNFCFCPLIFMAVYSAVGPWIIGEILEKSFGAVFMWGVVVQRYAIKWDLQYLFGTFYILIFHFGVTFGLASALENRFSTKSMPTHPLSKRTLQFLKTNILFIVIIILNIGIATFFEACYKLAFVLSTFAVWNVVIAILVWIRVCMLPLDKLNRLCNRKHMNCKTI